MSLEIFLNSWSVVLQGLQLTIVITAASFILGQLLMLPIGLALCAKSVFLRWPAQTYTFFLRGSPLLVQLFIIYYGLGQLESVRDSILWPILREPLYCAILAIGLNSAAYMAVVFAGAMNRLPPGQTEAAISLGMTKSDRLRFVLLPQVLRNLLPNLGNESILVLKASSLGSAVTLMDLTGVSRAFTARTFAPFEIFVSAGLVYLGIGFVLTFVFRWLERRFALSDHRQATVEIAA